MAKIVVKDTEVSVIKVQNEDYISLTDMLKAKEGEFFFYNWLRNRNTIEFLGIWEQLHNPDFNSVEFDRIKTVAGLNNFRLSAKEWMERTRAVRQHQGQRLDQRTDMPFEHGEHEFGTD